MFKNKKIVALVLLTLMVLAPFASAFAAPANNHLKNYDDAVTDSATGLTKLAQDYEDALKNYSDSGTDTDKKAVATAKEAYDKQLVKVQSFRALIDPKKAKEYEGDKWESAAPYAAKDVAGTEHYPADTAATKLKDLDKAVDEAKAKVSSEMVELYKKLGDVLAKANAASDEATKAKATLDGYATMYTGKDESVQKVVAPYMEKAYKAFAKVATPEKAKEWLAYKPADVIEALKDVKLEAAPKLEKDGYKVWAPEAAPEALNGAVELRLSKNDKGNTLMKLYDANGKEVESKGLLYVRMPIPKGVTANKIKVDGVETTFKVVDGTWEFAAEFKIAK